MSSSALHCRQTTKFTLSIVTYFIVLFIVGFFFFFKPLACGANSPLLQAPFLSLMMHRKKEDSYELPPIKWKQPAVLVITLTPKLLPCRRQGSRMATSVSDSLFVKVSSDLKGIQWFWQRTFLLLKGAAGSHQKLQLSEKNQSVFTWNDWSELTLHIHIRGTTFEGRKLIDS